jgi:uncharacterized SAM-binding protein YcdF (DUF218 family)
MFAIKTLLSSLLQPLPVVLIVLAVGLVLLWRTQRQRAGKVLVTVGFGLLVLFSLPIVGSALLRPLEAGQLALYPAERLAAETVKAGRTPRWIVVLGAGHAPDGRYPAVDRLGTTALGRLAEGVRLHHELPGTKLLLSGSYGDLQPHAEVLAEAAVGLGVPREDIELEPTTVDTEDEATKLGRRVGKDTFILVTSATHMARALALFRGRGLDPIPSPAQHIGLGDPALGVGDFVPQAGSLGRSQIALHEYIGRLWSRLRGRL